MARNKYPGICYRCGEWVPVGFGHFERNGSHWRVKCVRCTSGKTVTEEDPYVLRARKLARSMEETED